MAWFKRHLVVVISAAVAIGLIGFGGWYLMRAMDKNKGVDNEIGGLKAELDRLIGAPYYPSPSNIAVAQREIKRVADFTAEAQKFFPPSLLPTTPLNNQSFASLLHNTVAELVKEASAAGIRVETNYHFSFASQWPSASFPPGSLQPLSERLAEVKQLSSLLFKGKVNRLESIRRARVTDEIPGANSAGDYLPEAPHFNADAGMVMWPYEIVFHSFSPELAAVIEGISRMPEAYVVRSVVVEPAEPLPTRQQPGAAPVPGNAPPGRGGRGGSRPAAAAPSGLETILRERLLRVVLKVEVIKPAR